MGSDHPKQASQSLGVRSLKGVMDPIVKIFTKVWFFAADN